MACTHNHEDTSSIKGQTNSDRDKRLKKNIADTVYVNRKLSEEPTSKTMKPLLRRRKYCSLPISSDNRLQTVQSIDTSGTTISTHSLNKCSYPASIMDNERRLACKSQFNHEKQERKLRQETPQWDYIMEKQYTRGQSASHCVNFKTLKTENSLVFDTNHFEISEIDRDITTNGILRSAVKLPSIK